MSNLVLSGHQEYKQIRLCEGEFSPQAYTDLPCPLDAVCLTCLLRPRILLCLSGDMWTRTLHWTRKGHPPSPYENRTQHRPQKKQHGISCCPRYPDPPFSV